MFLARDFQDKQFQEWLERMIDWSKVERAQKDEYLYSRKSVIVLLIQDMLKGVSTSVRLAERTRWLAEISIRCRKCVSNFTPASPLLVSVLVTLLQDPLPPPTPCRKCVNNFTLASPFLSVC